MNETTNETISTTDNEAQKSAAGQFNNIVRELTNSEEKPQGNVETSFDNNAVKQNDVETEYKIKMDSLTI